MASELQVNTITEATSGSGITFAKDVIPATPLSHRNLIINGAMEVAQRGTSSSANTGFLNVDRFKRVASNNGTVNSQQVDDAPVGFKKSHKVTIGTADTSITAAQYEFLEQTIEGQNTIPLALGTSSAKQITLSFYVKSSLAGIFGGVIKNGAQNRSYPYQYTINSANTWERKTITLTGDTSGTWATDNTAGLKVQWSLGTGTDYHATANAWGAGNKVTPNVARSGATSGTSGALLANVNATWQITGVQLELGSVATPFEHRSFADELRRCQRYYYKSYDYGTAIGTATGISAYQTMFYQSNQGTGYIEHYRFKTPYPMRAQPSIVVYDQNGNINKCSLYSGSSMSHNQTFTKSALGTMSFGGHTDNSSTKGGFSIHALLDAEL